MLPPKKNSCYEWTQILEPRFNILKVDIPRSGCCPYKSSFRRDVAATVLVLQRPSIFCYP